MEGINAAVALAPWNPNVGALAVYAVLVLITLGAMLFLAAWLGEKTSNPVKNEAYECGVAPTGSALIPYPAPFYLVATFFLIFDVESVFIFSWAAAARELGFGGWLRMTYFIVVLLLSLVYIWKKGGLDWGPKAS